MADLVESGNGTLTQLWSGSISQTWIYPKHVCSVTQLWFKWKPQDCTPNIFRFWLLCFLKLKMICRRTNIQNALCTQTYWQFGQCKQGILLFQPTCSYWRQDPHTLLYLLSLPFWNISIHLRETDSYTHWMVSIWREVSDWDFFGCKQWNVRHVTVSKSNILSLGRHILTFLTLMT